MPFTRPGKDLAMSNQDAFTGRYNFEWQYGDPTFDDTEAHRVLSLLVEHRPSPQHPGYWADESGRRGSLLYTVKNLRRSTPSQLEAYASDALSYAVADNAITFKREEIQARRMGNGVSLRVRYRAAGKVQDVTSTVGQ